MSRLWGERTDDRCTGARVVRVHLPSAAPQRLDGRAHVVSQSRWARGRAGLTCCPAQAQLPLLLPTCGAYRQHTRSCRCRAEGPAALLTPCSGPRAAHGSQPRGPLPVPQPASLKPAREPVCTVCPLARPAFTRQSLTGGALTVAQLCHLGQITGPTHTQRERIMGGPCRTGLAPGHTVSEGRSPPAPSVHPEPSFSSPGGASGRVSREGTSGRRAEVLEG